MEGVAGIASGDRAGYERMRIDSTCVACSKEIKNADILIITSCRCHYCPLCMCSVLASTDRSCRSRGHGGIHSYWSVRRGRTAGSSNVVEEIPIQPRCLGGGVDDEEDGPKRRRPAAGGGSSDLPPAAPPPASAILSLPDGPMGEVLQSLGPTRSLLRFASTCRAARSAADERTNADGPIWQRPQIAEAILRDGGPRQQQLLLLAVGSGPDGHEGSSVAGGGTGTASDGVAGSADCTESVAHRRRRVYLEVLRSMRVPPAPVSEMQDALDQHRSLRDEPSLYDQAAPPWQDAWSSGAESLCKRRIAGDPRIRNRDPVPIATLLQEQGGCLDEYRIMLEIWRADGSRVLSQVLRPTATGAGPSDDDGLFRLGEALTDMSVILTTFVPQPGDATTFTTPDCPSYNDCLCECYNNGKIDWYSEDICKCYPEYTDDGEYMVKHSSISPDFRHWLRSEFGLDTGSRSHPSAANRMVATVCIEKDGLVTCLGTKRLGEHTQGEGLSADMRDSITLTAYWDIPAKTPLPWARDYSFAIARFDSGVPIHSFSPKVNFSRRGNDWKVTGVMCSVLERTLIPGDEPSLGYSGASSSTNDSFLCFLHEAAAASRRSVADYFVVE